MIKLPMINAGTIDDGWTVVNWRFCVGVEENVGEEIGIGGDEGGR